MIVDDEKKFPGKKRKSLLDPNMKYIQKKLETIFVVILLWVILLFRLYFLTYKNK